jgi:Amidohydrolase family
VKAFLNARVIEEGAWANGPHTSDIVVDDDGRIESVRRSASSVPDQWDVIDCGGQTVYPGLIDMHTHLNEASLELFVDHGVTTVRDVGNDLSLPVSDEAATRAAVNQLAAAGVDGIKLYMGIVPAQLSAAADEAHGFDLPITAHLGATTCIEAANAGIDTLEHAPQALYSTVVPPGHVLEWDKRKSLGQSRFWAQFLRGWTLVDPGSPRTLDVLGTLCEHGVALDPTLLVFQRMVEWASEPDSLRGLAETVDPSISEKWVSAAEWFVADWSHEDVQVARDALDAIKGVVVKFSELGGTIVIGTDVPFTFLVPGISLHQEIELMVGAGLSPATVLRAATEGAARNLGWAGDVGAIAPGRFADLVVCSGDPLEKVTDLAMIGAVYKSGHLVSGRP